MKISDLENLIDNDRFYAFTILSVASTAGMFISTFVAFYSFLGILFSSIYFLINSVFLGRFFFQDESTGFRIAFGSLVLLMIIALGSATVIIVGGLGFLPIVLSARVTILILASIAVAASAIHRIQIKRRSLVSTNTIASQSNGNLSGF